MGFKMDVEAVDFCEVRVDALASTMRDVFRLVALHCVPKQQTGIEFCTGPG